VLKHCAGVVLMGNILQNRFACKSSWCFDRCGDFGGGMCGELVRKYKLLVI
jgi:hypothetical protein